MNRGLYPAPDEEPPVSVSPTAASLPRADAPKRNPMVCCVFIDVPAIETPPTEAFTHYHRVAVSPDDYDGMRETIEGFNRLWAIGAAKEEITKRLGFDFDNGTDEELEALTRIAEDAISRATIEVKWVEWEPFDKEVWIEKAARIIGQVTGKKVERNE